MKRITTIICFFLLCSCTMEIWEDRSQCPCWFSIDFSEVDPNIEQLQLWFVNEMTGEFIAKDTVYSADYKSFYEFKLPRIDRLKLYAWGNIASGTQVNEEYSISTSLIKKDGVSADSLFFYESKEIATHGEFGYDTVRLNKEFANIDFILLDRPQSGDDIYINVISSTAGQYIDQRFIPGKSDIYCDDQETSDGNTLFRFRIMRQEVLEDLQVVIGGRVADVDVIMEKIPLGEFLKKSNYSMATKDLKDVTVKVNLSYNFVTIQIEDWQSTYPVDIEI